MTKRERFEQLAALAVNGEASETERAELEAALAENPKLIDELMDIGATDVALRRAADSAEVTLRRATDGPRRFVEPLPASVIETLESARRDALAGRIAADARADGAKNVVAFGEAKKRRGGVPAWFALAACLMILVGIALYFMPVKLSSRDIAVLSPRGETGFTQPTLVWDAHPGQRFDVWILPADGNKDTAPALYVAKNVEPPVTFANLNPGPALKGQTVPASGLTPDQNYRLLVCIADAGRIAGIAFPFRTAPNAVPKPPPTGFAAAQQLAAADHSADALAALAGLTPEERARPEVRNLEKEIREKLGQ